MGGGNVYIRPGRGWVPPDGVPDDARHWDGDLIFEYPEGGACLTFKPDGRVLFRDVVMPLDEPALVAALREWLFLVAATAVAVNR